MANYDLDKDKYLRVIQRSGITSDEEDKIIVNRGSVFHIYYVQNMFLNKDGAFDFVAVGFTHAAESTRAVFIRDGSLDSLFTSAHEVGHLLGLFHSDVTEDGGIKNPAFLRGSDPTKRLMYSTEQATFPTFLIKPEWDIINAPVPPL